MGQGDCRNRDMTVYSIKRRLSPVLCSFVLSRALIASFWPCVHLLTRTLVCAVSVQCYPVSLLSHAPLCHHALVHYLKSKRRLTHQGDHKLSRHLEISYTGTSHSYLDDATNIELPSFIFMHEP